MFNRLKIVRPKGIKPTLSIRSISIFLITIVVIVIVAFAIAIYGFKKDSPSVRKAAQIIPYPAAFVGWSPILVKDYNFTRDYTYHFYEASKLPFDAHALNSQIMDELVERKIVAKHASQAQVKVTQSDVDQAYQKLVEKSGKDEVNKVLSDLYSLDEKQFKVLIYHKLLKEQVKQQLTDKAQWRQVQVRHLLIKVDQNADQKLVDDAKRKADDNMTAIKGGKSLEEQARANSEDVESKDRGGELGYISRGQTVKEFENAIFADAVKKGNLLGPVRTQYGWHVIQIEDIRGSDDFTIWHNQTRVHTLISL